MNVLLKNTTIFSLLLSILLFLFSGFNFVMGIVHADWYIFHYEGMQYNEEELTLDHAIQNVQSIIDVFSQSVFPFLLALLFIIIAFIAAVIRAMRKPEPAPAE
ncbi:hypothetical protein JD969_03045 [Planctomycetota bacterium]|nr:hypothetical protein JD969_03045 [Planctomycetota bacterium]